MSLGVLSAFKCIRVYVFIDLLLIFKCNFMVLCNDHESALESKISFPKGGSREGLSHELSTLKKKKKRSGVAALC